MQNPENYLQSAMNALPPVSTVATVLSPRFSVPIFSPPFTHKKPTSKFTNFTTISTSVSTECRDQDEKFDWFSQWYPLMPECDLNKRAPAGKKVMGLDVVVWWDKNNNAWKVFDDMCPHRLAPLSQGRIDEWGRLQCVYHGWCFGGSGDCKFIPQASIDGPPVHTFKKACVAVYPSAVQNGIVWFWANTDPQYKDILTKKKPPYIPELDDPSFTYQMFTRDIPYGYETLIENVMDPSHVPYAHYGIIKTPQPSVKLDREGGTPIEINLVKIDKNGFTTSEPNAKWNFVSPCLLQRTAIINRIQDNTQGKLSQKQPQKELWIFICIPVSPGNSRQIVIFPKHFASWTDKIITRWTHHIAQNLVIDSDLYLLHVQEKKLMALGRSNWENIYFMPAKADANVVAYRKWLKKYAGGQIDWETKFDGPLPPTPHRELLMDRYWSHVVNCSSCNGAYKGFNVIKVSLQVFSVASVAILGVAATKQGMISVVARKALAVAAVLCFVGSKWLSNFIYKNYHFHDFNHAFK